MAEAPAKRVLAAQSVLRRTLTLQDFVTG